MSNLVIVSSISDVRAWIWNNNPGNCAHSDSHVDAIQRGIQDAEHPAYGEDWGPWLDQNAERFALEATK